MVVCIKLLYPLFGTSYPVERPRGFTKRFTNNYLPCKMLFQQELTSAFVFKQCLHLGASWYWGNATVVAHPLQGHAKCRGPMPFFLHDGANVRANIDALVKAMVCEGELRCLGFAHSNELVHGSVCEPRAFWYRS